ncbi:unnamed protein product [Caenorhabditis angaria]|uniref:T20D4.11-like domain-containing protein n=1 Tax=Caenorhabditis angaria TaxID=860376 RepID=A0A9P1IKZ5_9PELO|nr:unnamed protein product [Caenorhabditis angaria]
MHLALIFLFFPTIFCSTCDFLKLKYCEEKYDKYENVPEELQTNQQKIDKRLKMCEAISECGETLKNCAEDDVNFKDRVDNLSAGCLFLTRMYKDDFVDCAIVLEKEVEAKGCERVKPEKSNKATYQKIFDGCVDGIVEDECSLEQNRIYKSYREMGIDYLAKYWIFN